MYIPLELAKNLNLDNIPDTVSWKTVLKEMKKETNIFQFLWFSSEFLNPTYQGKFQKYNDFILEHKKSLLRNFGIGEPLPKAIEKSSLKECISMMLIGNIWAEDKEIYRFDAELEFSLADSEDVKLPVRILDRLPYRTIYIEFAEDGIFRSNFHGAFLHVVPEGNGYLIIFERVKDDCRAMFGTVALVPDKDEEGIFYFSRDNIRAENSYDRNKDWQEFGFFALNALLYLCAENNEIKENSQTKQTYRPPKTVKNKYSEIRKWDCGYRYGETIRLQKAQKARADKQDQIDVEIDTKEVQGKVRASVTPHTRRAHWHHYRVGKGRKDIILKWIPPVSVGYGDKVAVIRRVDF